MHVREREGSLVGVYPCIGQCFHRLAERLRSGTFACKATLSLFEFHVKMILQVKCQTISSDRPLLLMSCESMSILIDMRYVVFEQVC